MMALHAEKKLEQLVCVSSSGNQCLFCEEDIHNIVWQARECEEMSGESLFLSVKGKELA